MGEITALEIESSILEVILKREENINPKSVTVSNLTDDDCEFILVASKESNHIEEVISHYDSEEEPTWCTWQDVEGLDYGWMWLRYKEEHMKEIMASHISGTVRAYQKRLSDGEEFTLVKSVVDYHTIVFHVLDIKEGQCVYTWTFSDKDTSAE